MMNLTTILPREKQFYVQNGPVLQSGQDFIKALEGNAITDEAFTFHHERDDFSKWINEVLKDKTLARAIKKVKTKQSYLKKLKEA